MSELHPVEVRFRGEKLATYTTGQHVYTLYRTPAETPEGTEDLYRIHIGEGEGELAWLEGGHLGGGLTEEQIRTLFPEFVHAVRRSPHSAATAASCCGSPPARRSWWRRVFGGGSLR